MLQLKHQLTCLTWNGRQNYDSRMLNLCIFSLQIPFARSKTHLTEVVEKVCKNFEDYAQVTILSVVVCGQRPTDLVIT